MRSINSFEVILSPDLHLLGRSNFGDDRFDQFADREGLALDFVDADCIDQEFASQQHPELPGIEFGDQNRVERFDQFADVGRQRVDVSNVSVADAVSGIAALSHGRQT